MIMPSNTDLETAVAISSRFRKRKRYAFRGKELIAPNNIANRHAPGKESAVFMTDYYVCAAATDIKGLGLGLGLRDWKCSNVALPALFIYIVKYYRNLNARGPRN